MGRAVGQKQTTLGHARIDRANGGIELKLPLASKWRTRLRAARRPVKVTIREKVVDAKYGFVKERSRRVTPAAVRRALTRVRRPGRMF